MSNFKGKTKVTAHYRLYIIKYYNIDLFDTYIVVTTFANIIYKQYK